jgi:hypothetical protein
MFYMFGLKEKLNCWLFVEESVKFRIILFDLMPKVLKRKFVSKQIFGWRVNDKKSSKAISGSKEKDHIKKITFMALQFLFEHFKSCSNFTSLVQTFQVLFELYKSCSNITSLVWTLQVLFEYYKFCSNITSFVQTLQVLFENSYFGSNIFFLKKTV